MTSSIPRRRRFALQSLLRVALFLPLGGCSGTTFEVDGGLHLPHLDGTIALSNTTLTSIDEIDLATDLDLDSNEAAPWLQGAADLGDLSLSLWGFQTDASGDGTVAADFGDITAGSSVTSQLDVTLVQGRALHDLIEFGDFELCAGIAVQWIDVSLDVDEQTFGLSEAIDVQQPVPLLAARAEQDLEPLLGLPVAAALSVAWIRAEVGDVGGGVLDLEALVRARFDRFGVFAGWRTVQIDLEGAADGQEFAGDVDLAGFLFGATLRF